MLNTLLLFVLAFSQQCLAASTISVKPAMPPPLASATAAAAAADAGAAASSSGGSNPVFALAGFLKDQLVRMKDGTVECYTNHKRCTFSL